MVEFLALGVLLLVPIVYLVLTVARLQAATFAVDSAAREAARAFVTADDEAAGRTRALAAVRLALLDQGFDIDPAVALTLACPTDAGGVRDTCLTPESHVAARVSVDVVLPGIPGFVDDVVPVRVTVRAHQVAVVDAFRAVR